MLKSSVSLSVCLLLISYIIQTDEAPDDGIIEVNLVDKMLGSIGYKERPKTMCQMWEIMGQLAQKYENADIVISAVAPVYIRSYIEWTEAKFLIEHFNVSIHEMVKVLGQSMEELNKEAQKIIDKATMDGDFLLKDNIKDNCSIHYIRWRYILAKRNDENIRALREIKKQCNIEDDIAFATEMAYLWTRTSVFVALTPPESSKITLGVILEGLRIYKMAFPNTERAVEALFRFITNQPKMSSP